MWRWCVRLWLTPRETVLLSSPPHQPWLCHPPQPPHPRVNRGCCLHKRLGLQRQHRPPVLPFAQPTAIFLPLALRASASSRHSLPAATATVTLRRHPTSCPPSCAHGGRRSQSNRVGVGANPPMCVCQRILNHICVIARTATATIPRDRDM